MMVTAKIKINGTVGSVSNLIIGVPVLLENTNNSGIVDWSWSFIQIPPNSSATLSTPTSSTSGFTPDVVGSYLIKLTVNGVISDERIGAVLTPNLSIRIPAAEEVDQFSETYGWSRAIYDAFIILDDSYAYSASPLITKGDIFTYSTTNTRLPLGTDGYALTSDSAQSTGLLWKNLTFDEVYNNQVGAQRVVNIDDEGIVFNVTNAGEWDNGLYITSPAGSSAYNLMTVFHEGAWAPTQGAYVVQFGGIPYDDNYGFDGVRLELATDSSDSRTYMSTGMYAHASTNFVNNNPNHSPNATIYGERTFLFASGTAKTVAHYITSDTGIDDWDIAWLNDSGEIQFDGGPIRFGAQNIIPLSVTDKGFLYTREADGYSELFYLDDYGLETQLTLKGGAGATSPLTSKGDLYTYSTGNARLPVGVAGQVLTVDLNENTGLRWIDGSGMGLVDGYLPLPESISDPPYQEGYGSIYSKDIDGYVELFYIDDYGLTTQITDKGTVSETSVLSNVEDFSTTGSEGFLTPVYHYLGNLPLVSSNSPSGYSISVYRNGILLKYTSSLSDQNQYYYNSTLNRVTILASGLNDLYYVTYWSGQIGSGGGTDDHAIHKNVADEINQLTEKTSAVNADVILIEDSDDNWNKKYVSFSNIPATGVPLTTKGDLFTYDTNNAKLSVGPDGYFLSADSSESTGLKWTEVVGSSPLTTKGDIYVYGSDNTRLGIGTDGYVLSADSGEVTGLKWIENSSTDINAIHSNVAGEISILGNVSPADQDYLLIEDFNDSNNKKQINIGDLFPLGSKGDIFTYSTERIALSVGGNGQVLSVDLSEDTGLKWINVSGLTDGYVRLPEINDPSEEDGYGKIYSKDIDGYSELFYIDNYGSITQITDDGYLNTFNSLRGIGLFEQESDPPAVEGKAYIYSKRQNGNTELFFKDGVGEIIQVTIDGQLTGGRGVIDGYLTLPPRLTNPNLDNYGSVYSKVIDGYVELFYQDDYGLSTRVTNRGNIVNETLLTTKGDILTRTNSENVRLEVGPDGYALLADSTVGSGIRWGEISDNSPLTTKGDLYAYGSSNVRLPVGTDGYALLADSSTGIGLRWGEVDSSPLTTKGDIYVFGSNNTRISVGNDGYVLSSDSNEVTGLKWVENSSTDVNAIHSNVAGEISILDNVSPADQDYILIEDFNDSNNKKQINIGDLFPLGNRGDIFTYSTERTALSVGESGQILSVDLSEGTGLKWINVSGLTDGYLRLPETNDPIAEDGYGKVYSKDVDGYSELFYLDDYGLSVQVTNKGDVNAGGGNLPLTTKGDILTRDSSEDIRLGIGNDGYALIADSSTDSGLKWGEVIGGSPLTTKGDIYVYGNDDTRLGIGNDGYVLSANSGEVTGLKWVENSSTDVNAIHNDVAGEISILNNVSPADQDYILIEDFNDSNNKKQINIGDLFPLGNKGDIFAYSTERTALGIGEDGQVLSVDSNEDVGLKWVDISGLTDGYVRLPEINDPIAEDGYGKIYSKDIDGYSELFYLDDYGLVVQVTNKGNVNADGGSLPLTTKGDILTRDSSEDIRLGVGNDGYALLADSSTDSGLKWGEVIGGSPLTTKGDIYVYGNGDTRIGVGTNGQVLSVDSNEGVGLKWVDNNDLTDGYVRFPAIGDPNSEDEYGKLYSKGVDGYVELFYVDNYGSVTQITDDGYLKHTFSHAKEFQTTGGETPGDIIAFSLVQVPRGSGTIDTPSGYDIHAYCQGVKMKYKAPIPTATNEYYYDSINNEIDIYASGSIDDYEIDFVEG